MQPLVQTAPPLLGLHREGRHRHAPFRQTLAAEGVGGGGAAAAEGVGAGSAPDHAPRRLLRVLGPGHRLVVRGLPQPVGALREGLLRLQALLENET